MATIGIDNSVPDVAAVVDVDAKAVDEFVCKVLAVAIVNNGLAV